MYIFIVSCLLLYGLKKFLSAPCRWRDNSAETCNSYVEDFTLELQKSAFVSVGCVICSVVRVT